MSRNHNTPPLHEMQSIVNELVEQTRDCTRLSENQAKTLIYYALATYGLPKLRRFPILAPYGDSGSGKTTILRIAQQLCYKASPSPEQIELFHAANMTKAALRRILLSETTVLLDEGDDVSEDLLHARYARANSVTLEPNISEKRQQVLDWNSKACDYFGATVIHRRKPFRDHSTDGRTIFIHTKRSPGGAKPFKSERFSPYREKLESIASSLN